jgi:ornithine carbamoyltransferase
LFHPTQILADLLTILEVRKSFEGLSVAWVGDGNNMLNSFLVTLPRLGIKLNYCTPLKYQPTSEVLSLIPAGKTRDLVKYFENPKDAVSGSNFIITDTWISMGQEQEKQQRLKDFKGFRVTKDLLRYAAADWIFMHCLPRKQEEVDDEVNHI